MRWLHLILCVLALLILGLRAADAHTAAVYAHPSMVTDSGVPASVADATDDASHHRCKPGSGQTSHANCLPGSGISVMATSAEMFSPPADGIGLQWPLSASSSRGTEVSPPFHPPKLSIRA